MKNALVQVFVYFGTLQILSPILVVIPCIIYMMVTTGTLEAKALMEMVLIPGQLVAIVLMMLYLWKAGHISKEKMTWSPISLSYQVLNAIFFFSGIWLVSILMSHARWIPDLLEQSFDCILSSWAGIFAVAVAGPILEELLFRGTVEKMLLKQYNPQKAILLSALIFGVFHLNPAQIVPAFLIGLMLGWVYYKTASLIPCILIHIINNSLSVYLSLRYPDAENLSQVMGGNEPSYWLLTALMVVLFVGAYLLMRRTTIAYPWKKES